MLLNSWLKNLTARLGRAPTRPIRRRNPYRLTLEPLESRLTPAFHTWTGGGVTDIWSDPANWDNGAPTSGEADGTVVIFPDSDQTEMNIPNLIVDAITFSASGNAIKLTASLRLQGGLSPINILNNNGTNEIVSSAPENQLILLGSGATIHLAGGALVIKSRITEIPGAETDLIQTGNGVLELSATGDGNSYTGSTRIDSGTLRLNTNTANAGLSRNTQVGDGAGGTALLELLNSSEIPDGGSASVFPDGFVIVRAGVREEFTSLIVNGGRVILLDEPGLANAVLGIKSGGSVSSDGSAGSTITGSGTLELEGGTITFNVFGESDRLLVAARITEIATGTELRKIGAGTLELAAGGDGNAYTGATRINRGALVLNTNTDDNGLSSNIFVGDEVGAGGLAVLQLVNTNEIPNEATMTVFFDGRVNLGPAVGEEILNLRVNGGQVNVAANGGIQIGSGGQVSSTGVAGSLIDGAGELRLAGDANVVTFDVANGADGTDLLVAARITDPAGTVGLIKTGLGSTLELTAGGSGNTYAGLTRIEAGTLRLNTTTDNAGLSANIFVGDGRALRGSAVLQLVNSGQIPNTAVLSVLLDGRVNLGQDVNEEIRNLVLLGGQVNVAADGNIQIGSGGQVFSAGAAGSVIDGDGEFRLASETVTFDIADVGVGTDLVVAARITEVAGTVGLIKTGIGTLELSAGGDGNSYTGDTNIRDGTLRLNTNTANRGLSPFIVVGDSIGEADSAVLELRNSNEIPDEGQLVLLADGRVDVKEGVIERLRFMGVHGGQVNLAANGVVQIGDGGQVFSLVLSQVSVESVIDGSGTLQLDGTVSFAVDNGPAAVDLAVTAIITGIAGLTKSGTGLLQLSGTNTYTGSTTVAVGTLQVNGSQPNSAVSLVGGTLGGSGTVGPITATGGTLAPGLLTAIAPVALKSGNLALGAATFAPLISGTPGGAADQLVVTGTVNLTGGKLTPFRTGIGAAAGQAFRVLDNDAADPVVGTFVGLREGATLAVNGQTFVITYRGGDGNDVVLKRVANVIVTGPDAGAAPRVRVFDAETQAPKFDFLAYPPKFKGGVRVATADVNGDGFPDIITAPGPGTAALVKVFSGATQPGQTPQLLQVLRPYGNFKGGAFVATGDVNGDGIADIIVGPGSKRAPTVVVFNGASGARITSFNAFPAGFKGGVTVAAGDVNGDGKTDIIAGMGSGSQPRVRVFDAGTPTQLAGAIGSFLAYPKSFKGGVFVAAGDLNGDGSAEVITGPGAGTTPLVKVFTPATVATPRQILAYPPGQKRGVRVSAGDVNGDGKADILTALGPAGNAEVRAFNDVSAAAIDAFFAEARSFKKGLFVAGSWSR